MRSLLYTTGSPFARGIRVVLDEIGLDYERREETTTPSAASRAEWTPALQVPTLHDGDLTLWESGVIAEYLLATYPQRVGADLRQPDVSDLALCDQVGERADGVFDRHLGVTPVQVVHVDVVDSEPGQGRVDRLPGVLRR